MTEYEACRRWLNDIRDKETCKVLLESGKSIKTILIEEIDRLNILINREKNHYTCDHKNRGPSNGYIYTPTITKSSPIN